MVYLKYPRHRQVSQNHPPIPALDVSSSAGSMTKHTTGLNPGGLSWRNLENKVATDLETYTLGLFNIAMENGPFIDGLPIKNGDFPWKSPFLIGKPSINGASIPWPC